MHIQHIHCIHYILNKKKNKRNVSPTYYPKFRHVPRIGRSPHRGLKKIYITTLILLSPPWPRAGFPWKQGITPTAPHDKKKPQSLMDLVARVLCEGVDGMKPRDVSCFGLGPKEKSESRDEAGFIAFERTGVEATRC